MDSIMIEQARNTADLNSILFSSSRLKQSYINITSEAHLKKNFSMIKFQQNNMCSSMISTTNTNSKKMNKSKTNSNNLKRIKQAISNKLKKFQFKRNLNTDANLASPNQAKLVKFNYKSYFVQPELEMPIQIDANASNNYCKCSCQTSDGEQSFRSYISTESNEMQTDLFLFNNSNQTTFRAQPVLDELRTTSTPNKKVNQTSILDESTQLQVDSPVLLESTFNTSSCSHLSDDLIILQTGSVPVKNVDLVFENRQIPNWALGPQLNLAVVNQHYFNADAASEIFY